MWKGRLWRAFKPDATAEDRIAIRALLCGLLVPLVVFSISKSKLPLYMTPLFVPLCILLGRALERLLAGARLGWKSVSYVAAGMIVREIGFF